MNKNLRNAVSFMLAVVTAVSACLILCPETALASEEGVFYSGTTYVNPVATGADPGVLFYDGVYYMYSTNAVNSGYVVYTSTDLVSWASRGYCLRKNDAAMKPGDHGNSNGYWAPEVFEYNGTFYMVYTCAETVAIAQSSSPLGPFKDTVGAIFPDTSVFSGNSSNRTIDGHIFRDDDGTFYMYFVHTAGSGTNNIYGVEFDMDTLTPVGTPIKLISAELSWERRSARITEGPFMLKHDGKYYLTYSANGYSDDDYCVGCATSASPLGTFAKYSSPILSKTGSGKYSGVYGPGHHCFTTSPDGSELFIVYHVHPYKDWNTEDGTGRLVAIDRAYFDGSGKLCVNGPTTTEQPLPSGAAHDDDVLAFSGPFAQLSSLPTVYLCSGSGSDTNSGSATAPFKTLTHAYEALAPDGGTIVIMNMYDCSNETDTAYFKAPVSVTGPVFITGSAMGMRLSFRQFEINQDTMIDNIVLRPMGDLCFFQGHFHNLYIGERTSTIDGTANTKYPILIGGYYQYGTSTSSPYKYYTPTVNTVDVVSCSEDYTVEVRGGTWRSVFGGNFRNSNAAHLGNLDCNLTLKVGGNISVRPYQDVTSEDKFYVSATGHTSVLGGTIRLEIDGGDYASKVFVQGRFGGQNTSSEGTPKSDGNLEMTVRNAFFHSYVYNSGAQSVAPFILAKQEDVPEDLITGSYSLELYGGNTFDKKPTVTATGVLGGSTVYYDSEYSSFTYKNFNSKIKLINGDSDFSGSVDSDDLAKFARHISGVEGYTMRPENENSDINGDGKTDSDDLAILARYISGVSSTLVQLPDQANAQSIHSISLLNTGVSVPDDHEGEENGSSLELNFRESYELTSSDLGFNLFYPRIKKIDDDHYILVFHNGKYGGSIYCARSSDGINWDNPSVVFAQAKIVINETSDNLKYMTPDACVLSDGRIICVTAYRAEHTYYNDIKQNGISIKISHDNGETWGEEKRVYTGLNWEPSIMEAANGEIYIFFTQTAPSILQYGYDNRSSGVGLIRSCDGGATWTPNVTGEPFLAQSVMRMYTATNDLDIKRYTDQMPVAVQLHSGEIALAVESYNFKTGAYKFSISYNNDGFAEDLGFEGTGPSNRQSNVFNLAGPYIAQFDSGETVLTYHWASTMRYRLGNSEAKSFYTENTVFPSAGMWGSCEMISSHCVSMAIGTNNANHSDWGLEVARMYLNHRIDAKRMTPSMTCSLAEWKDNTDALFVGSDSQAQVSVRAAHDDGYVYLLAERLDDVLTDGDECVFYIAGDSDYPSVSVRAGLRSVLEVIVNSSGSSSTAADVSSVKYSSVIAAGGQITELAIPKWLFSCPEDAVRVNVVLRNNDGDGTIEDTMSGTSVSQIATWKKVVLK